jgi:hypothetical protein
MPHSPEDKQTAIYPGHNRLSEKDVYKIPQWWGANMFLTIGL